MCCAVLCCAELCSASHVPPTLCCMLAHVQMQTRSPGKVGQKPGLLSCPGQHVPRQHQHSHEPVLANHAKRVRAVVTHRAGARRRRRPPFVAHAGKVFDLKHLPTWLRYRMAFRPLLAEGLCA